MKRFDMRVLACLGAAVLLSQTAYAENAVGGPSQAVSYTEASSTPEQAVQNSGKTESSPTVSFGGDGVQSIGETAENTKEQAVRADSTAVQIPNVMTPDSAGMSGYTVVGSADQSNTDSTIGLGGASITLLKGKETGQQLCLIVKSSDGHLLVVDGGLKTNAPYLAQYIRANGGRVDAWLLTHPHVDHCGALAVMLEQRQSSEYSGLDLGEIYYGFASEEFYQAHEQSYRLPFIQEINQALGSYDSSRLHYNSPAGTTIQAGNVSVTVMNQAFLSDVDAGNNTSIVYMISVGGKRLLVLGDTPYELSQELMKNYSAEALKADIVQIAHHGQHGGSLAFYSAISPRYALWPSSNEIWDQVTDSYDENQETYTVALTKHWMDQIGVQKNYIMKDGNWTLK